MQAKKGRPFKFSPRRGDAILLTRYKSFPDEIIERELLFCENVESEFSMILRAKDGIILLSKPTMEDIALIE